jgi:hypothetical protein
VLALRNIVWGINTINAPSQQQVPQQPQQGQPNLNIPSQQGILIILIVFILIYHLNKVS